MTLEQFVRIVLKGKDRNWLGRMTPAQLREATASMLSGITDLPPGATVDWVLTQAMAGKDEAPASVSDGKAELGIPPAAASQQTKPKCKRSLQTNARACELVREQLADGPKPESTVMAAAHLAEIPERSLIAAASALGVRTPRGQWRIPGQRRDRQRQKSSEDKSLRC
jgi:hypothetical protein